LFVSVEKATKSEYEKIRISKEPQKFFGYFRTIHKILPMCWEKILYYRKAIKLHEKKLKIT